MKPTDQNIDDLFRHGMDGFTEEPPATVWDAIEERLDEQERKRPIVWIRPLLWVMLLAFLSSIAILIARRGIPGSHSVGSSTSHIPGANGDHLADRTPLAISNPEYSVKTDASVVMHPQQEDELSDVSGATPLKAGSSQVDANLVTEEASPLTRSPKTKQSSAGEGKSPGATASPKITSRVAKPALDRAKTGSISSPNTHTASTATDKALVRDQVTSTSADEESEARIRRSASSSRQDNIEIRKQKRVASGKRTKATENSKSGNPDTTPGLNADETEPRTIAAKPSAKHSASIPREAISSTAKSADGSSRTESASALKSPTGIELSLPDSSDEKHLTSVPGELISSVPLPNVDSKFEKDSADGRGVAGLRASVADEEATGAKKEVERTESQRTRGEGKRKDTRAPRSDDANRNQGRNMRRGASGVGDRTKSAEIKLDEGTAKSDTHLNSRQKGNSDKDSSKLTSGKAGNGSGMQAIGEAPETKPGSPVLKMPFYFKTGMQLGRELGFSTFHGNKTVLDVFFEWTAFGKWGIGIAPAIKWSKTSQEYTLSNGNYVQAGNTDVTLYNQEKDSFGGFSGYASYAFVQRYDSFTASKTLGRTYRELELPVSLFYHITKNWTISGGVNLVWGTAPAYTGTLNTTNGLIIRDTVVRYYDTSFSGPAPAAKFAHAGVDSFSKYKDPASDPAPKPFRYGYTFALRYTHSYGISAELSMRQQLGGMSGITDAQMKSLLRQTYFRFSLGYELGRSKK